MCFLKPMFYSLIFSLLLNIPAPQLCHSAEFFWGVANSAFQVEGSPVASDWYHWTKTNGKISDKTDADIATDFWNKYPQDIELVKNLGANAFRISIAWERIEPTEDSWDEANLQHYEKIILAIREAGIEPWVTLHHFAFPKWLAEKKGVLNENFPKYFARFAKKVVERLAKPPASVHWWMTFNEPNVLAMNGFLVGKWPPGIKGNLGAAIKAEAQMAEAHIQAYREIKSLNLPVEVGVAHHWRPFEPYQDKFLDRLATKVINKVFNRYFLDAIFNASPCSVFLSFICPGTSAGKNEKPIDFIGFNYYGRTLIDGKIKAPFYTQLDGPGPRTDMDWEVYPEGLYQSLKEVSEYQLPMIITENGLADRNDKWRADFLKSHIEQVMRAKKDGYNVFGYLHWSLTDNFEWAEGTWPRFGLVDIDYKTLKRSPRPSYFIYKEIIKTMTSKRE